MPVSVKPPPTKVEVAAHAGMPFEVISTWPAVPIPRFVSTFEAEAYKISPIE